TGQPLTRDPPTPPVDRLLDPSIDRRAIAGTGTPLGVDLRRIKRGQRQPDALARAHGPAPLEAVAVGGFEVGVAPDEQGVITTDGAVEARAVMPNPGIDGAVVESGHDRDAKIEGAALALDDPHQLAPVARPILRLDDREAG